MHIQKSLNCYGCRACAEICPKNAIKMKEDGETFVYPDVDEDLCVNCGRCIKVCPINFDNFVSKKRVKPYVGVCLDGDILFESSSGGAYRAISQICVEQGYIVWGVKFDENLDVKNDYTDKIEKVALFSKSKYVQSDTDGCFSKVLAQLKEGHKVLFQGTPCQVSALEMFLKVHNQPTDSLLTITTLCHGTPSQHLFNEYISYLEKKDGSRVLSYIFRNKRPDNGIINTRTSCIIFENGKVRIKDSDNDPYLRGYYYRLFLRPSCLRCQFARKDRVGDFTIGDAWHIDSIYDNLNSQKGCSLLMFNTEKSLSFKKEISRLMDLKEVPLDWAMSSQDIFDCPTVAHKNRTLFFKELQKNSFKKAVYKCIPVPL